MRGDENVEGVLLLNDSRRAGARVETGWVERRLMARRSLSSKEAKNCLER